ncbi:MAG: hypothetical protein HJJLKODD_01994 [Phycisphaerae bacterium]|nr:hypothetical protein [Phycisphaerae bacterium]
MAAQIPGYKYLFATHDQDTAILRLPDSGLGGLLGLKKEWRLYRQNTSHNSQVVGEASVNIPTWALEKGIMNEVSEEILRWQNPKAYDALWRAANIK